MIEQQTQRRTVRAMLQTICGDRGEVPATLVIQAHPDDEVVGMGSRLPRLQSATFVHVTDGAPRDGVDASSHGFAGAHEYALARRHELEAALALAGIAPEQLREIGCPDQGATLSMTALSRQLARLIDEIRPELIITHPYEGGHPDHDATALAVHAACELLCRERLPVPAIAEASSYHNSEHGIESYRFLPPNTGQAVDDEILVSLTQQECELKRRMLACFPTQQETLRYFPVGVECFRPAPRYDFTCPPHEGLLFYERFSWGMTGDRFRALAQQTIRELKLEQGGRACDG